MVWPPATHQDVQDAVSNLRASVSVKDYGATGNGTTDDTSAINAAITAAQTTSSAGTVIFPAGQFKVAGQVTVPDGVTLVGQGANANTGYAGTTLVLSATGAGVTVNGSGGGIRDLLIDGANVANYPLVVNLGANRNFFRMEVRRALLDNITINKAQNASFVACTSDNPTRDSLVLDNGCGGLHFVRFNTSNFGRYALRVEQTTTTSDVYPTPQHIEFAHCIFEQPINNFPLVKFNAGFYFDFLSCIFQGSAPMTSASPLMDVGTGVSWISLNTCEWFGGNVAGMICVRVASGASVSVDGTNWMVSAAYFTDCVSGLVRMNGDVFTGAGVLTTAATPADQTVMRQTRSPLTVTKSGQFGTVISGGVDGEAGQRFRLLGNGSLTWGSGADYNFPTQIYRRGDGAVGIDPKLVIGGTQATITGSRGGNAALASLLTALAATGLIVDGTTA